MRKHRTLLLLAATGTIAILTSVSNSRLNGSVADDAGNSPVGSWRVEVTPVGSPVAIVNFSSLTSDGLIINANETGVVALGNWAKREKTGSRHFDGSFTGFQVFGTATFRYKVLGKLELSLTANRWTERSKPNCSMRQAHRPVLSAARCTQHAYTWSRCPDAERRPGRRDGASAMRPMLAAFQSSHNSSANPA